MIPFFAIAYVSAEHCVYICMYIIIKKCSRGSKSTTSSTSSTESNSGGRRGLYRLFDSDVEYGVFSDISDTLGQHSGRKSNKGNGIVGQVNTLC